VSVIEYENRILQAKSMMGHNGVNAVCFFVNSRRILKDENMNENSVQKRI